MGHVNPIRVVLVLGLVVVMSGCATKNTKKEIHSLRAQVGALTEEVVRLDSELQAARGAALQSGASGAYSASSSGDVVSGIYRTPSGFELPTLQIQQALKNAGYYRGGLDGKIGPETRTAIEAFQRDQGLKADGVVGRNTWDKLKVYINPVK